MVHFRTDDMSEVIDELERISQKGDGSEWVTISPWVDPEHLPVVSVLKRIFSARGSKVPEATWVPPQRGEPAQLGFLHSVGANAYHRLVQGDARMPESWVKVSDHSKRGLLFAIHPDASAADVLQFTIEASQVLAEVPTDDRWVAQVSNAG